MTFNQVIHRDDEPVKGTLIAGNVRIPFTAERMEQNFVMGRVGENINLNTFYASDNWTFEPDVPPLPTEPGFYASAHSIRHDGSVSTQANIFHLAAPNGPWYDLTRNSVPEYVRDRAELLHKSGGLVRLHITRA